MVTAGKEALRRLVTSTLMPGFEGTAIPAWIIEAYAAGLASVCLYGSNMAGAQALSSLTAALRDGCDDLVIAVDEEGGDVTRLHYLTGSPEPGNALLGRLDDTQLTRESAARVGRELAAYGINFDLAPVVDINSADDNPVIGARSFGSDAAHVARHSAAWIDGLQSVGVAACAKHFPGHGDTETDSHHALPRIEVAADVLDERELEPFRAAVAAGSAAIMTSHIVVSAIDPGQAATFSHAILTGVLRERLGFDGVIVSDALDMAGASAETGIPEAAVRALAAGCDLLCLGTGTTGESLTAIIDAVMGALDSGRLAVERVEDAAARVATLAHAWPANPTLATSLDPTLGSSARTSARTEGALEWAQGFEVSDRARAWLAIDGPAAILQVDSRANLAVGHVAWGPAAAGATYEFGHSGTDAVVASVPEPPQGTKVAVVGRGLVPSHPAWRVAERLRAAGQAVIVVECGWPRGGADVVTFGASLAVGQALAEFLGVVPASSPVST